MSWLTDRLNEPSTHAGLAVLGTLMPQFLPLLGMDAGTCSLLSTVFTAVFGTAAVVKSDTPKS